MTLKALKPKTDEYAGLETIAVPPLLEIVYASDELTAVCPVTGQPDYYTVDIEIQPRDKGLESKSLKLYLRMFHDQGVFCEALAQRICDDVWAITEPMNVLVALHQKSRGGITITAKAYRS